MKYIYNIVHITNAPRDQAGATPPEGGATSMTDARGRSDLSRRTISKNNRWRPTDRLPAANLNEGDPWQHIQTQMSELQAI